MKWIAPESSQVFSENGKLLNANGRYQKHFRDLEGLYEDGESFSRLLPEWSEKVVYQVEDHRASDQPRGSDLWNDGDDAWKGWKRIFHDPRASASKSGMRRNLFRFIRRGDSPAGKS